MATKMKMVMKGGKSVPAFAADGKGKMKMGGSTKKKMGMGGMHAMPDGTMMPDKAMMKKGGAKKYKSGGITGDDMSTVKATKPLKKAMYGASMMKGGTKKK